MKGDDGGVLMLTRMMLVFVAIIAINDDFDSHNRFNSL